MDIPKKILAALEHVRLSHPDVVRVTFAQEDSDCGGFWTYETAAGVAPAFGPEIDVYLLEQALDCAWEQGALPLTYSMESGND